MARRTVVQQIFAFEARGKFGRPASFGRALCGYNLLGLEDALCGIYQKKTFANGRDISFMRYYRPKNPRSVAQQANRARFAAAMSGYQALTDEQKLAYSKKAKRLGLNAWNLFIRDYMRTH